MTPAYVLSKVYMGLCREKTPEDCLETATMLFRYKRDDLPAGWTFYITEENEPTPNGSILIGGIICLQSGESDLNLWALPMTSDATVLQDKKDNVEREEKSVLSRYSVERRYQDSGWEVLKHVELYSLQEAKSLASVLSCNAIVYGGMARVIDRNGRVIATYSSGDMV